MQTCSSFLHRQPRLLDADESELNCPELWRVSGTSLGRRGMARTLHTLATSWTWLLSITSSSPAVRMLPPAPGVDMLDANGCVELIVEISLEVRFWCLSG